MCVGVPKHDPGYSDFNWGLKLRYIVEYQTV